MNEYGTAGYITKELKVTLTIRDKNDTCREMIGRYAIRLVRVFNKNELICHVSRYDWSAYMNGKGPGWTVSDEDA